METPDSTNATNGDLLECPSARCAECTFSASVALDNVEHIGEIALSHAVTFNHSVEIIVKCYRALGDRAGVYRFTFGPFINFEEFRDLRAAELGRLSGH